MEKNKRKYRRSLFANRDIKIGEKFTEKNIISLRPKIGICATKYISLLNKKSKRRYIRIIQSVIMKYYKKKNNFSI